MRIVRDAMNIPASYTETRRYDGTRAPLADVASKALQSLGWEFEPASLNSFGGKIPWSIWSWGENFQIQIEDNGSIQMKSECSFPLTIVSWGKNKRNVQKLFRTLEDNLTNEE
jgi:hypothetical protein